MSIRKVSYWLLAFGLTILGTAMHFVHHLPWSESAWHIAGYIFPINECCWEHMKMVFYPLLLLSIGISLKNHDWKCFAGPILAATLTIPTQIMLFYSYQIFVGHSVLPADIAIYWLTIFIATWYGVQWGHNEYLRRHWKIGIVVAIVWILGLAILTYHHPDMFLFDIEE